MRNSSFVPIFEKIMDSSVWEEPYPVRILWISMLAAQHSDHIVRGTVWDLKRWANMPVNEVEDALRVLSSPDSIRKGQPHEGRRIEKVDDGWFILNGERYQKEMQAIYARARKRRWAERRRAKKGPPLTFEAQGVAADGAGNSPLAEKLAEPPTV
jgi:hypothetical protein